VPAHLSGPGQGPESHKTVVVEVVIWIYDLLTLLCYVSTAESRVTKFNVARFCFWCPSLLSLTVQSICVLLCMCWVLCSKVQARHAFATYLTCIQQRLVTETRNEADADPDTANEQMVCIVCVSAHYCWITFCCIMLDCPAVSSLIFRHVALMDSIPLGHWYITSSARSLEETLWMPTWLRRIDVDVQSAKIRSTQPGGRPMTVCSGDIDTSTCHHGTCYWRTRSIKSSYF